MYVPPGISPCSSKSAYGQRSKGWARPRSLKKKVQSFDFERPKSSLGILSYIPSVTPKLFFVLFVFAFQILLKVLVVSKYTECAPHDHNPIGVPIFLYLF